MGLVLVVVAYHRISGRRDAPACIDLHLCGLSTTVGALMEVQCAIGRVGNAIVFATILGIPGPVRALIPRERRIAVRAVELVGHDCLGGATMFLLRFACLSLGPVHASNFFAVKIYKKKGFPLFSSLNFFECFVVLEMVVETASMGAIGDVQIVV